MRKRTKPALCMESRTPYPCGPGWRFSGYRQGLHGSHLEVDENEEAHEQAIDPTCGPLRAPRGDSRHYRLYCRRRRRQEEEEGDRRRREELDRVVRQGQAIQRVGRPEQRESLPGVALDDPLRNRSERR